MSYEDKANCCELGDAFATRYREEFGEEPRAIPPLKTVLA